MTATYREIAQHFRLGGPDAARTKVKRSGWPAEPANHPADVRRIRVPREAWDQPVHDRPPSVRERPRSTQDDLPLAGDVQEPPIAERSQDIKALPDADATARERVAHLEGELAGLREALAIGREQADAAGERERGLRERLAATGAELAAALAQATAQRAERERDAFEIVRLTDAHQAAEIRAGRAEDRLHHARGKVDELQAALAAALAEAARVPTEQSPGPDPEPAPEFPVTVRGVRTTDSGEKVAAVLAKRRWWRRVLRRDD